MKDRKGDEIHDEILRHLDSNPPPQKPAAPHPTARPETKPPPPPRPAIMLRHMALEPALDRLERFLRQHHRHGTRELTVIVGKGSRSAGGESVLGPAVEDFCRNRPALVLGLREAPPAEGGGGAWIVELANH